MKKILIFIGLLCSLIVSGQGAMMGVVAASASSYPPYSYPTDDYAAYLADMTVDPTEDTLEWQDRIIYSLDSAGVWDGFDAVWLFAQKNSQGALLNLHGGQAASLSGTILPFTIYAGFTGDGSGGWITSNINLSTETPNYSLNSGSLGVYVRNNSAVTAASIGAYDAGATSDVSHIYPRLATDGATARINQASSITATSTDSRGFWCVSRTDSDEEALYKNAESIATGSISSAGVASVDLTIHSLSGLNFSNFNIAFAFVGRGFSDTEIAAINAIVELYMDRINKGVQ